MCFPGRIRAIQLNYTEAHTHLQQAIRRAPHATVAPGFLQIVSDDAFEGSVDKLSESHNLFPKFRYTSFS